MTGHTAANLPGRGAGIWAMGRRISLRRVKRFLVGGLVSYLLAGALFAVNAMPQQTWACPDRTAPHGYVTYGGVAGPPRDDCQPTVTLGERAQWFAFASTAWLPLIVAKGSSNMTEP